MQLTQLHFAFHWSVCWHCFLEIFNGIFVCPMKLMVTKEIWSCFCGIWELMIRIALKTIRPKEISSDTKEKEVFWEITFCSLNSLHRVPSFCSWSCFLIQFSWYFQSDIWEHIEGTGGKGNVIREKGERSYLRNFFVVCEFISQSSTFLFMKLFANTVFMESAKWYLGALWGLWWKRKCSQIKTRKRLSEKLVCRLWNHLTELHLSVHEAVC